MVSKWLAIALLVAGSVSISAQQAAPAKRVRIAFLYSDGNLPATLRAYKALLKERPPGLARIIVEP